MVPTLDALVSIREALGPDPTLLLDSGIRTDADVFTTIALGSNAVLLGPSPHLYGLAITGQRGVEDVITNVFPELDLTMALTGVRDIASITPAVVRESPHPGAPLPMISTDTSREVAPVGVRARIGKGLEATLGKKRTDRVRDVERRTRRQLADKLSPSSAEPARPGGGVGPTVKTAKANPGVDVRRLGEPGTGGPHPQSRFGSARGGSRAGAVSSTKSPSTRGTDRSPSLSCCAVPWRTCGRSIVGSRRTSEPSSSSGTCSPRVKAACPHPP